MDTPYQSPGSYHGGGLPSSDYQQHDYPYRVNGSGSRDGWYPEDVYKEDEVPNYNRREGSGAVVAKEDEGYSCLSFSSIGYVGQPATLGSAR